MKKLVLDGDSTTGHSGYEVCPNCFYPSTIIHGSGMATLNGKKLVLHGDSIESHCCRCPDNNQEYCHTGTAIGNSNVTLNGVKLVLDGASITCGDILIASGGGTIE